MNPLPRCFFWCAALPAFLLLWFCAQPARAAGLAPVMEGAEGQRAFDDLAAYYPTSVPLPNFGKALEDLGMKDEKQRQAAGRYLAALFAQSFADESNGRAEWQRQPYWGGGAESPAREFRKELGRAFGKAAHGEEALEATLWLIRKEKFAEVQNAAGAVLPRIDSPKMEAVLAELLAQPHPNAELAVKAIEETGRRKLVALAPRIRELCQHYRTSLREAARKAAPMLGLHDLPEYRPAEAFSPWLTGQLTAFLQMLPRPAPVDAKWGSFKTTYPNPAKGGQPFSVSTDGWLLGEKDDAYEVLTWFGVMRTVPKKDTVMTAKDLAGVAREIGELYQGKDTRQRTAVLSERGGLTGQFENPNISTPAALVSAWGYERGDRASAAALLFPRIDALSDDRWLGWIIRDQIGGRLHRQMLEDFCLSRDYPSALRLAEQLSKPVFAEYEYQDRAQKLAVQLKARADDFKTFRLPTPEEWKAQSAGLARADQIRALLARLPLLNCIQQSQPGGVEYSNPQFAEPYMKAAGHGTPVINPLVELQKMQLTVAELPLVLPLLLDETFIPTFSYWRDFHPARTLHQVNWVGVGLVDSVAKQDLVKMQEFSMLDKAGREKRLEEMTAWCRAHSGKSGADLLLEAVQSAPDWRTLGEAAVQCIQEKTPGALPVILRRAGAVPEGEENLAEMLSSTDAPELVPAARNWVKSDGKNRRFYGALILLRMGDRAKNEGFAEVKEALAEDDGTLFYPRAIEPLLARGDEASVSLATGILTKKGFSLDFRSDGIVNRLLRTGRPEVVNYLVKELESTANPQAATGKWEGQQVTRTFTAADYTAKFFEELRSDSWKYEPYAPDADRAKLRGELKAWLTAQVELIRAGKPTALKPIEPMRIPTAWVDAP